MVSERCYLAKDIAERVGVPVDNIRYVIRRKNIPAEKKKNGGKRKWVIPGSSVAMIMTSLRANIPQCKRNDCALGLEGWCLALDTCLEKDEKRCPFWKPSNEVDTPYSEL